jgi:cyclopropane fatty-acyl-phospholipid synthase-like methyltransferase
MLTIPRNPHILHRMPLYQKKGERGIPGSDIPVPEFSSEGLQFLPVREKICLSRAESPPREARMKKERPLLYQRDFPRSNAYDPDWVLTNQMGPNVLWLAEWLCTAISLSPGCRVLDLGCGKALSSVFLVREFGSQVWAVDLWADPGDNRTRVAEAGCRDRIEVLQAEAHALPFEDAFFDAVLSLDAYQYFGTDDLYLGYLSRFLKPGGMIGIAVPGLMRPMRRVPAYLSRPQANGTVFWEEDCRCFHTLGWWKKHWSGSSLVRLVLADTLRDGWKRWAEFEEALEKTRKSYFPTSGEALRKDRGRTLGFIRLVGTRTDVQPRFNLYEPGLLKRIE